MTQCDIVTRIVTYRWYRYDIVTSIVRSIGLADTIRTLSESNKQDSRSEQTMKANNYRREGMAIPKSSRKTP